MRKIGVWMPLRPLPPGSTFRTEGLFRLLGMIGSGMPDDVRLEIVAPVWLEKTLQSDIAFINKAFGSNISLRTVWRGASVLTLYYGWRADRQRATFALRRTKRSRPLSKHLKDFVDRRGLDIISAATSPEMIVLVLAVLLLGLLTIPLATVVGSGGLVSIAIVAFVARRSWIALASRAKAVSDRLNFTRKLANTLGNYRRSVSAYLSNLASALFDHELFLMARRANPKHYETWFVLHAGYASARNLRGRVVCLFPDFAFFSCPDVRDPGFLRRLKTNVARLMRRADHIITLSDHVRAAQLPQVYSRRRNAPTTVIPHAPVDVNSHSTFLRHSDEGMPIRDADSRERAAVIIRKHIAKKRRRQTAIGFERSPTGKMEAYLDGFPFEHTNYILCSTQIRPYKNVLMLVKAIEHCLRHMYVDVKLIITGAIEYAELFDHARAPMLLGLGHPGVEVAEYIFANSLQYDVLSIHKVPESVHAALYHAAAVTVHPSFMEGGRGAFPIWESISVGTPVLASRNPATLEDAIEPAYQDMLFDPYDHVELAERIRDTIARRDAIFADQWKLFQKRRLERSWADVAAEYVEVFTAGNANWENTSGHDTRAFTVAGAPVLPASAAREQATDTAAAE